MSEIVKHDYVAEFKKVFSGAIEGIVKASEIYVKAIDENPLNKVKFIESCSDFIPTDAWAGFEAIGRRWMHPKLLMGGGGKYSKNIKKLPYSDQRQIFEGARFDMLTSSGEILKVDVRQIEPAQAEQMFDKSHIRSVAEQKAFIESRKPDKPSNSVEVPYTFVRNGVHFTKDTVVNKEQLRRILQEI